MLHYLKRPFSTLVCLAALSFIISVVQGAPLLWRHKAGRTLSTTDNIDSRPDCGLDGNADFYGLGIRLGIYLQWITSLLANLFLKESIEGSLETNTIFLLAVFVATLYATAHNSLHAAEAIVLLHLCFGFLFSILSIWGHRTRSTNDNPIRFPLLGSFFRLTLSAAICAYSVWFWFSGQRLLSVESCPAYTFMFAPENTEKGLRIFYQVQSSIFVVLYGAFFCRELLMITCFLAFTSIWSTFIAGLSLFFSYAVDDKNGIWLAGITALRRWITITSVLFWARANGKESSGKKRPTILLYVVPVIDVCTLVLRSTVQFVCLFLFKIAPPVGYPPLLIPVFLGDASNHTIKAAYDSAKKAVTSRIKYDIPISTNQCCPRC